MDDFIRHCWNDRVPDAAFIEEIQKKYNETEIAELMRILLQFCGQTNQTTQFLFNYLFSIIQDNPLRVFPIISELNCNQEIGFLKLFAKNGDSIFNLFEEITQDASKFALQSLHLVLKYLDYSEDATLYKEAIDKLSQSSMFNILLASSRISFPEDFKILKKQFETSIPLDIKLQQLNLSQINLISALFKSNVMNFSTAKSQLDIICLFSACLKLFEISDDFYDSHSSDILEKLFLVLVEQYIESPSLQVGFLITNHLVHKILKNHNTDFDAVSIRILIEKIKSNFEVNQKSESNSPYVELCAPRIKSDYSLYYPKGLPPNEMNSLLTTPPPFIDNEKIFSTLFQYPMFISHFVDYFVSMMIPKNIDVCSNLTDQIIPHISDFILLLKTQKKFGIFLESLNNFLTIDAFHDSYKAFSSLWYLFLIILRSPLHSGSQISMKLVDEFIEKADHPIQVYLKLFLGEIEVDEYLQLEKEITIEELLQITHPYYQSLALLSYLVVSNDLESVLTRFEHRDFLLSSAFIWGIKVKHPSLIQLASLKMPAHELIDTLFYRMMAMKGNSLTWLAGINSSKIDYDFMISFHPKDISQHQFTISNDLISIAEIRPIHLGKVNQIIISWRSIIRTYGIEPFIRMLIEVLLWNAQTKPDPISQKTVFLYAALLIIFSCENDQETLLNVFKITIDFIDNGDEQAGDCVNLAEFLSLIAISLREQWKDELMPMLQLNEQMMNNEAKTPKMVFAIHFLKASLYIHSLNEFITVDMLHPIFFENDCQAAIDFFISKELELKEA